MYVHILMHNHCLFAGFNISGVKTSQMYLYTTLLNGRCYKGALQNPPSQTNLEKSQDSNEGPVINVIKKWHNYGWQLMNDAR